MSKSATEQFQIKKKRKLPLNVNAAIRQNNSNKRSVHSVPFSSELLIKENFSEFYIGDKQSELNALLQKISKSRTLDVYNFSDLKCLTSHPTKTNTLTGVPVDVALALSATTTKNYLRDQTQVLRNDIMPLSHGFYVKGALASKRGLKALKTNSSSGSSTAALPTYEVAKRPRRSNENVKVQTSSLMVEESCNNNLQLSYLLGESLARHGRLQEAFDIYAIIASQQPEGFIPLEKLNILATALVEHIRILSSNSKKTSDLLDAEVSPLKATTTSACLATKCTNNDQFKLITPLRNKYASSIASKSFSWQPTASYLTTHSAKLKDLETDFLASAVGGNLDLHAPSRELPASGINSCTAEDYDPFMCPLCRDVLRCPVTTNCGHTFCRQCCETISMCNICHVKFPRWQKDDIFSDSPSNTNINCHLSNSLSNKNCTSLTTLATATNTTTTTMGLNINNVNATNNSSNQQFYNSETSLYSTSTSSSASSSSSSSLVSQPNDLPRLQIRATPLVSPTTVTTTTIACTTDTATTTMASNAFTSGITPRSMTSHDNVKFMPDVLVRRLVEKWWGCDLQAKKINETATSYMHLNLLDDALKFCNASLEKSPTNFKSLLLRAEVLRKMNHYQSSLADVDNALKTRYTSPKAHYLRALALSDLSRYEEALYEICLAIGLDKSASLTKTELFQHDLIKILQKLLSQTPKCLKAELSSLRSKEPYSVYSERRLLRKNISLLNNDVQDEDSLNLYEDEDFLSANYGKECDILAEEDVLACADFLNCADKRTTYANIAKKYEIELKRQTTRKHFRRKWMQKEMELLPSLDVESARCSSQFRNVLERMQQEIVRLKKLESSPEYFQRQLAAVSPALIDSSDFDCVLCCRTFWKPVVTPCGHTYCLVCLDRCMDYTSSCPLCMSPLVEPSLNMYNGASSPVPLVLTKRPVTKFLEAAIKRFIPESYNKRFRQEMVMEPSVPIFICTTAFPYVPCPLFVYEQRYRLMVRRAVESGDKQFGIVQPHSEKSRYFDYGCILDIRDCVLLGDGCSILSTIGCKRFKILARHEKDGYETAKVEYIHDETIPEEHLSYVSKMHDVVLSKAIQWYKSLEEDLKHEILQSYGEMPVVEENWETIADGPAWAWWIIALLPLRPQLKVDILATTSLEKRLRAIEKTIHSMPGSYYYQRVSQNCDVAVVVHTQQHHHRVDDDVDVRIEGEETQHTVNVVEHEEDDLALDGVNEQEQNQQQVSLQHHIENRGHDQQQHSSQTLLEQQQQMHQQQCEDISNVDECCQRTTSTALLHRQLEVAEDTLDITSDHHHHHHHHHTHHRHRRSGHAHSLLL